MHTIVLTTWTQTKYAHVDYLPCLKELMKKDVRKVEVSMDMKLKTESFTSRTLLSNIY